MRQYVVSEITPDEMERLTKLLTDRGCAAGVEGIFWLPVPEEHLTDIQKEHAEQCGPHVMALETNGDSVGLELLVRAKGRIRCDCIGWAGDGLVLAMMREVDALLAQAGHAE